MSHIVIYTDSNGNTTHRECNGIEEAASIVERLRNDDGIDGARICSMREIKFTLRPAYKVELAEGSAGAGMNGQVAKSSPPVVATAPPPPAEAAQPQDQAKAPEPAAPESASAFTAFAAEPAAAPPPPAASAPPPPAPASGPAAEAEPEPRPAPARRGLFGR